MANFIKRYTVRQNRLEASYREGFVLMTDGSLVCDGASKHILYITALDSGQADCKWGRLAFGVHSLGDMLLTVRAFASNQRGFRPSGSGGENMDMDSFLCDPQIPYEEKRGLFAHDRALSKTGSWDMLLFGCEGRYLWLAVELLGHGDAVLRDFRVMVPGENFLQTFPEIYREEEGFFHRYLAIFSSMYSDFQDRIDALGEIMDIDTAPAGLLPVLERWVGIEMDGNFLDENCQRMLLRSANLLIRKKGTRKAVERIVRILTDAPFWLVERQHIRSGNRRAADRLYGDSPFWMTVLIGREADERLHAQLLFLLGQFKPVRSRISIIFLDGYSAMDSYCYLDINARIARLSGGSQDNGATLDGTVCLT